MNNKQIDILKELLFEIDEICQNNGLKYTLTGELGKYIIENKAFPDSFNHIAIAMPFGDVEKLIEIVNDGENYSNRKIEYILNNEYATCAYAVGLDIRYYSLDTTFIDFRDFDIHKNHGFFINIEPIVKERGGKKGKLLRICMRIWRQSCNKLRNSTVKNFFSTGCAKFVVGILGRKRACKYIYCINKKIRYIDKWSSMSKKTKIRIKGAVFYRPQNWKLSRVKVNGKGLYIEKEVLKKRIDKRQLNLSENYNVVLENVPFDKVFEKHVLSERLSNIQTMREKYIRLLRKSQKSRSYIRRVWDIYLMTQDIVYFRKKYDDKKVNAIKSALRDKNIKMCREEIQPYINAKQHYEKLGIDFIKNELAEEIILMMKNAV